MTTCKNCGNVAEGKYCNHCGQKLTFQRISAGFIIHEIFHFFTHLEKGFFFTTFQLLKNPGPVVVSYINGKRKVFQTPVSYFLIWTTIFILFLYGLEKLFGENGVIAYQNYFGPGASTRYAISNLSLVLTIIAPFQALYLYLLATKQQFNYFETLVMAIYSLGTILSLQFLFAVLALISHLISGRAVPLVYSDTFKVLYLSWFVISLNQVLNLKHKILKATLILIMLFGTFTLWRTVFLPKLLAWLQMS